MARKSWTAAVSAVYTDDGNWLPISVRTGVYKWTVSGSGTSNYYLELIGGGSPGLTQPANVYGNGALFTAGTAGALTASQWGWGDVDTLGFNTVYVRLADSTDPDSKAINFVTYTQIPVANDDVRFPADAGAVDGTDQSAVSLTSFIVEDGYKSDMGSATTYLRITTARFEFSGGGGSSTQAFIDLAASAISPQVFSTARAAAGNRSLYLLGSALSVINVVSGDVGLAFRHTNETATVGTIRSINNGASVWVGANVTLTTFYQIAGSTVINCACTTITCYGGTIRTREVGAITTFTCYGGTIYPESTGTITTLTVQGASVDFTQSSVTRTVTNLKHNSGSLHYDPVYVTVTNRSVPDFPVNLQGTNP